jgi:UDP-glucuronate decarboxylase
VTGPINIGNPHEIPIGELAQRIIRLTGAKSRIVYRPLPQDDPMQRCPDITLARSVLGWQPSVALDSGLDRTIAYFRDMLASSGHIAPAVTTA